MARSRATPGWRTCCARALWSQLARRPRAWSCRGARAGGGSRRTRPTRSSPRCATRGVRYGAGRAMLPQRARAPRPGEDGAGRRLARRPGAERGRPQPAGQGVRRRSSGRRPTRCGWCCGCCPTRTSSPRPPTGCSTDEEQALLLWAKPPQGPGVGPWSLADAVLVDEVADLLDRTPAWATSSLDEAQDLSPMMLRAVGRRCSTGSAHRPRRPGAGHDAVGDPVLGRGARAISASRTRTSRSSPWASGCPAT